MKHLLRLPQYLGALTLVLVAIPALAVIGACAGFRGLAVDHDWRWPR